MDQLTLISPPSLESSMASWLASQPDNGTGWLAELTVEEQAALYYTWRFWARGKQLPPDDVAWWCWVVLAGRGFGKTRTGAGWVHERAMAGNEDRWIALIAETPGDARDMMIEGPGGILKNAPPWEMPVYEPSKRRLEWPTGAWATVFSGAHPEQVRGFSGDTAWCDETASWMYPRETWDNLLFGMREAKLDDPKVLCTTTPKPIALIKELQEMGNREDSGVVVISGSSYENRDNLSPVWFDKILSDYEGTTLGQQEIYAMLLSAHPDALWDRDLIEDNRVSEDDAPPLRAMKRIAVGVDPATTSSDTSAETGIMVGGVDRHEHGFLLGDHSLRARPGVWGQKVVDVYHEYDADIVVAEANNGGEMVKETIQGIDPDVPVKIVYASRGKRTRAEPVQTKMEKGRVHHVGYFEQLEDQMCNWVPGEGESPDRMDGYVWAFTELLLKGRKKLGTGPQGGMTRASPWKQGL